MPIWSIRPALVIWVVTRISKWAALIAQAHRVLFHFSLAKHSLFRRETFLKPQTRTSNYFLSYQCADAQAPLVENLTGLEGLFFDNDQPATDLAIYSAEVVSPLNTGVGECCRR